MSHSTYPFAGHPNDKKSYRRCDLCGLTDTIVVYSGDPKEDVGEGRHPEPSICILVSKHMPLSETPPPPPRFIMDLTKEEWEEVDKVVTANTRQREFIKRDKEEKEPDLGPFDEDAW